MAAFACPERGPYIHPMLHAPPSPPQFGGRILRSRLVALAAAGAGLVVAANGSVDARTWRVTSDHQGDAPTIAAACDSAAPGDVVLVAPGLYTWTSEGASPPTMARLRPGITVLGENGAAATILDGEYTGRLFGGDDLGDDVVIEGLTLRHGYVESHGGAVRINGASRPVFRHCVFVANHATQGNATGGAVSCDDAVFEDCEFIDNRAALDGATNGRGGAISCRDARIERCTFRGNRARGFEAASGGAIGCVSSIIRDCVFEDNWAACPGGPQGGAISSRGAVTIERCQFRRNHTDAHYFHSNGGAVELLQGTIRDCLFLDNVAQCWRGPGRGGAVFGADFDVIGCVFAGNRALRTEPLGPGQGGVIYSRFGLLAEQCTLVGNSAGTALGVGGIWSEESAVLRQMVVAGTFDGRICNGNPTWSCSIFFANEAAAERCGLDDGSNATADPQFCTDPRADGDVSVRAGSPCTGGGLCAAIGAGAVECPATALESRTWSDLKILFR